MKILGMKLENFQGIKSFEFSPGGDPVSIFGANGTGKTTIYNAFCWLMYGKPSTAEKNFSPQTVGSHNLNHSVEMTVEIGDEGSIHSTVTLRKDYHEVYKTKRGSAENAFAGYTTDYFIDGVPTKEKDYLKRLEDYIGTDEVGKVLTRYNYFLEDMNVKDRRRILLEVFGNITDEQIIASDSELSELAGFLGNHTIEEYVKIATAQKKEIDSNIKLIPSRIDEAARAMPEKPDRSEEDLESILKAAEVRKEELLKTRASLTATAEAELRKKLADVQAECSNARAAHLQAEAEKNRAVNDEIALIDSEITDLRRKTGDKEAEHGRLLGQIKTMQADRERLLAEYKSEASREWSGDTICPTCGQELPAERIDEAKAAFNRNKSDRLTEIKRRGAEVSEEVIRDKSVLAASVEQEVFKLQKALEELEAKRSSAQARLTAATEFDSKDFDEKIAFLNTKLADTKNAAAERQQEIDQLIRSEEEIISETNNELISYAVIERQKNRISELEDEQTSFAGEYDRIKRALLLCEAFSRKKAELLDERINSNFKTLRFRLFREQINGGIEDDCEALIPCHGEWVPFKSANNAARINAGLEVIDTLSGFYGFSLPVFIDNAEGCTDIIPTNAQQIKLYVSAADKSMRVQHG